MFLPIRSKNPPESFPGVTCALIAINTAVYIATSDGFTIQKGVMGHFGEKSSTLSPVTLLTSMFLHGDLWHIAGNMWFLYLFGFAVEGRLRSLRFAGLYFGSGLAGGLMHHFMWGQFNPTVPSIGASGAIMGVVGAAVYLFPHAKIQFFYCWWEWFSIGVVDIAMWAVALMYVGLDVVFAVWDGHSCPDGIAHFAHIGGALGGLLICALYRPRRDTVEASVAKAILAASKDFSTLYRSDLAELHKVNPEDTTILVNWMMMCLEDDHLSDECTQAFVATLPRIIAEQNPLSVASCLSGLGIKSHCVLPQVFVEVAAKVEQTGNPSTALVLYDHALRDSRIRPMDEVYALFRSAFIYEFRLGQSSIARNWYEELVHRYPLDPLSDQAKNRLFALRP